jgi:hypothetical protein
MWWISNTMYWFLQSLLSRFGISLDFWPNAAGKPLEETLYFKRGTWTEDEIKALMLEFCNIRFMWEDSHSEGELYRVVTYPDWIDVYYYETGSEAKGTLRLQVRFHEFRFEDAGGYWKWRNPANNDFVLFTK